MKKLLIIGLLVALHSSQNISYSDVVQNYGDNTSQIPVIQKVLNESEQKKFDELCQKADELLEQNQPSKAYDFIVKASELHSTSDMIYALTAKNIASGAYPDYQLIKSSAENSLKINPNNYIALDMLGYVYLHENNYEQALFYFERSMQHNSNYTLPIFHLGELYSKKKDYRKAAEYYNTYITKNYQDKTKSYIVEKSFYKRGYDYIKQDKFDNAFEDGSVLIALNNKNPYGYSLKAMAMVNMPSKKKDALKLADKSIKLDTVRNNADLYLNKIYTYGVAKDWSWTVELDHMNDFVNAEQFVSKNIDQLYDLLKIYQCFAEHNPQKELELTYLGKIYRTVKKILDINPNDEQAQKICEEVTQEIKRVKCTKLANGNGTGQPNSTLNMQKPASINNSPLSNTGLNSVHNDAINKNEVYYKLISNVLDKNLSIGARLKACEDIRNLPDTTNLSKAQLRALKIAARYKIYDIWARTKVKATDESLIYEAKKQLKAGSADYLKKVQNSTDSENDLHTSLFFLGLYEYASGNKNIGTQSVNDEFKYFQSKNALKKQYILCTQIRDITVSICDENKTVDEIVNLIKSINY